MDSNTQQAKSGWNRDQKKLIGTYVDFIISEQAEKHPNLIGGPQQRKAKYIKMLNRVVQPDAVGHAVERVIDGRWFESSTPDKGFRHFKTLMEELNIPAETPEEIKTLMEAAEQHSQHPENTLVPPLKGLVDNKDEKLMAEYLSHLADEYARTNTLTAHALSYEQRPLFDKLLETVADTDARSVSAFFSGNWKIGFSGAPGLKGFAALTRVFGVIASTPEERERLLITAREHFSRHPRPEVAAPEVAEPVRDTTSPQAEEVSLPPLPEPKPSAQGETSARAASTPVEEQLTPGSASGRPADKEREAPSVITAQTPHVESVDEAPPEPVKAAPPRPFVSPPVPRPPILRQPTPKRHGTPQIIPPKQADDPPGFVSSADMRRRAMADEDSPEEREREKKIRRGMQGGGGGGGGRTDR